MVAKAADLKERRTALGLTQVEVAELAGLSDYTVSKAENGETVSPRTLKAIDEALHGVEVNEVAEQESGSPSEPAATVRSNIVRVRTAALGVEIEATYSDSADREVAMRSVTRALAELMKETGGNGATGDPEGGSGL